jgi:hypothetical protein
MHQFDFLFISLALWIVIYAIVAVDTALIPRRASASRLFVRQLGGMPMADRLTYAVSVGPVVDHDVLKRELSVVVNGLVVETKVFPADAVELGTVTVEQDATVELMLVDVDDAGNRSEPATLEFVAVDTLPPSQPGALGVTLVSEAPMDVVPDEEVVNGDDVVDEA